VCTLCIFSPQLLIPAKHSPQDTPIGAVSAGTLLGQIHFIVATEPVPFTGLTFFRMSQQCIRTVALYMI
jgi:hypothetical protein